MSALVDVSGLTKRFHSITAVDDISFAVHRGEVLGFLGPNGAGKSTTMKMIAGFLTPDSGSVDIDGVDCSVQPVETKRRIGYLPEGAPLYGDMSPLMFLRFIAEIRGYTGSDVDQRVDSVVEQVHLESVLDQPIDTLSKGFKRRVGIAQAILHDPEVLILDEPTDGLDPNQKHEVRKLIRAMAPEKAIILSTHILEEVDAVCTRAMIVAGGKVVADGDPAELQARSPRHNAVTLRVRALSTDAVAQALSALDGVRDVQQVEPGPELVQYLVRPINGTKIIDQVSAAARENGWIVEEMYVERGRLDDVFRQVTEAQSS